MTDFAKNMRREANDIAALMVKKSRSCPCVPNWSVEPDGFEGGNVKPFYSPYANFNPVECQVVFIGINPAGNPRKPDATTGPNYLANLNKPRGKYNAYLDETWESAKVPGEAGLQRGVQKVFQALYPADVWEQQLRNAASLNVCPLRTRDSSHIPCDVWIQSERWCNGILGYLKPKLIICCGHSDNYEGALAKSPWAMLKRQGTFEVLSDQSWKLSGVSLKYGKLKTGSFGWTFVVGLQHLSTQAKVPATIKLLKRHRREMNFPQTK